jgi:hypothetical protein
MCILQSIPIIGDKEMRNKIICKLTLLLYVNWILILPKGGFQSDQALHHRYKKRGMIMYQTLWNSINHQIKKSHASAAFLAVSLIEWTTLGLLAGFFISIIGGMSAITKLTVILCAGGYTGLIFGFFGGILYLYRTDFRHSSAESSPSATARLSLKSKTAA